MTTFKIVSLVCAAVGLLACTASGVVNVQTVPVGNAGNAAIGTRGAVGYTYNIGKYEVTAGQYTEFLNAVGGVDTYALYNAGMSDTSRGSGIARDGGGSAGDPHTYSVAPDFANRPVNYVSYWDACRFANWLHNGQPTGSQGAGTTETGAYALTTDGIANNTVARNADWRWATTSGDEWFKAAYHRKYGATDYYFSYPTSSNAAPGRDMADVSGNNANSYGGPYPIDSGKYTTMVGEFQNSASPYGTFDQGGNVWEWNETVRFGGNREILGSSFHYTVGQMRGSASMGPTAEVDDLGFRVVQVPEPVTMALLALASAGILRRTRA